MALAKYFEANLLEILYCTYIHIDRFNYLCCDRRSLELLGWLGELSSVPSTFVLKLFLLRQVKSDFDETLYEGKGLQSNRVHFEYMCMNCAN